MIRRIIFMPVWLLTPCIKPFLPAAHPWKRKKLTLQWWVDGGTENAFGFGVIFWFQGIFVGLSVWFLYHG